MCMNLELAESACISLPFQSIIHISYLILDLDPYNLLNNPNNEHTCGSLGESWSFFIYNDKVFSLFEIPFYILYHIHARDVECVIADLFGDI